MTDKSNLLSIGEITKLTGVGVQAMHYYERKNILHPAYVDPYSGYRYYSLEQMYYVIFIANCVQLGIPLKEVAETFNAGDIAYMKAFLERGNKVAQRKIKILELGVEGFNKGLEKIEQSNLYQPRQIYRRAFPSNLIHWVLVNQPLRGAELIKTLSKEMAKLFGTHIIHITDEDNVDDLLPMPEIGCMCRYTAGGKAYFMFSEISDAYANENSIRLPAGEYFFRQDECSRLEEVRDIFEEQLGDTEEFIIIETQEPFLSKSKISQPMYELRVII